MIQETVAIWVAIVAYAISTALFVIGVVLSKPRVAAAATVFAGVGLASQTVAIIVRWARTGHGPLVGFYEVALVASFGAVLGFLLLQWRYRGLRMAGVAVMPVSFLILGATLLVSNRATAVTGSLASVWLLIHIAFAQLGFAFYVAGFVLAVAYLMRDSNRGERFKPWLDKLPEQDELDSLTLRIVGAGFLFQGIMIASGAIWANEAWGRYWSWDPIESWSLIAWAIYAIYLHLTLTRGWRGRKAAWVLVIALPVIIFSVLGVPVFYNSIHGAYLAL
jgi:cytochrome c-type biogenesis protein CcsB